MPTWSRQDLPYQVVTYFIMLYLIMPTIRTWTYTLPDPAFDTSKKMTTNFESLVLRCATTQVKIVVIFPFSRRLRILKGRRRGLRLDAWTRKMHYLKFAAFMLSFSHSSAHSWRLDQILLESFLTPNFPTRGTAVIHHHLVSRTPHPHGRERTVNVYFDGKRESLLLTILHFLFL